MSNLQLIKWHAQELYKLLEKYSNDAILAGVCVQLEAGILNSSMFKNIQASPPNVDNDTADSNKE